MFSSRNICHINVYICACVCLYMNIRNLLLDKVKFCWYVVFLVEVLVSIYVYMCKERDKERQKKKERCCGRARVSLFSYISVGVMTPAIFSLMSA